MSQRPAIIEPDAKIAARMPAELVAELRQAAERHDRSFSAELREAIRSYLGGLERNGAGP